MKQIYKKICVALLLVFVLALPGVATAATYFNVKVNLNGKTQVLELPIDLESITKNYTKTFRFVYTYKDGKWILTSKEDAGLGQTKPTAPPVPSQPKPSKPETPAPDPSIPDVNGLTADEGKMLELVNQERQKLGLKPLKIDMRLVDLSRKKSKDMIDKNYFGHTSPTYGTPFDALKNNGISYRYAGENLAGAPTVERAHSGLMNSPGHRANILNPNFTHIGIGVVEGGPYGKMFTQTFIGVN
jgi:uncharacterized YkwD family protein